MIIVCKVTSMQGRLEEQYINLTIGKNYTALSDFNDIDMMIEMVDDAGDKCWYPKNNFYSLEAYRDYKLGKIGI
jgi:hypothetical protein